MKIYFFDPERARKAGTWDLYRRWAERNGVDLTQPFESHCDTPRSETDMYLRWPVKNSVGRTPEDWVCVGRDSFSLFMPDTPLEDFL